MINFEFRNPTKIVFGKGQIAAVAREVPPDAKVMMTYGGGSIKQNGVYDQVMKALEGRAVVEFGGVEPNPEYATLMKAVDMCRREGVQFLLAVGGGSVLDGTKFIALAAPYRGEEPWDIVQKGAATETAIPLGTVLTLAATGSESNMFSVVSRRENGEKLAFANPLVYPRFAVLDPETTFSLPPRQVANGVVDAFVHTTEQYLTFPVGGHLQDRFAESILNTLIQVGQATLAEPNDYEARASFVWAATMALNGLIGCGVPQDWTTHFIGHELTALYNIDHARTLAVVWPHLHRVQAEQKREKLLQFAERVWGVRDGAPEQRVEEGIRRTEQFFESLGVPTRLAAYEVSQDTPALVASRLEQRGMVKMGERQDIDAAKVRLILERSLGKAAA
jgi:NADP-dependent alcohol dehydrogenase